MVTMATIGVREMQERYNGWTNRATWNVFMWLQNSYYSSLRELSEAGIVTYREILKGLDFDELEQTPDGILYLDESLDYAELDEMLLEMHRDFIRYP